jgi:nicotinamide-nucleotide amidase
MSAEHLVRALRNRGWKLATAESCTGGMVAAAMTDIAGSSDVFDRGFVTYSNEAKSDMLGVPADLIGKHGAVSEVVARAMAKGALRNSMADIAVSITGVAGPGGGSVQKPVGLVHFACATKEKTEHLEMRFGDLSRAAIREAAVQQALQLVLLAV